MFENRVLQEQKNAMAAGKQGLAHGIRRPGMDLTNLTCDNAPGKPLQAQQLAPSSHLANMKIAKLDRQRANKHYSYSSESVATVDSEVDLDDVSLLKYEDIDARDVSDPQAVIAYVDEIYAKSREKELTECVTCDYLSRHSNITANMRAILIDWMIDVHLRFKLLPETMFLAVHLIDKFLSKNTITRDVFQLVGITCMFIACKYEEIYPPECNDFIYITESAYTRKQMLEMERVILNSLGFKLMVPSSLHFLRRFSKAAKSDYRAHTLCKYLIELALVDYSMIKYCPSKVAAAAIYLTRIMINGDPDWNTTLQHYTKYKKEDILPCARDLLNTLNQVPKQVMSSHSPLRAAFHKYSSKCFWEVSKITPPAYI